MSSADDPRDVSGSSERCSATVTRYCCSWSAVVASAVESWPASSSRNVRCASSYGRRGLSPTARRATGWIRPGRDSGSTMPVVTRSGHGQLSSHAGSRCSSVVAAPAPAPAAAAEGSGQSVYVASVRSTSSGYMASTSATPPTAVRRATTGTPRPGTSSSRYTAESGTSVACRDSAVTVRSHASCTSAACATDVATSRSSSRRRSATTCRVVSMAGCSAPATRPVSSRSGLQENVQNISSFGTWRWKETGTFSR